MHIHEVDLSARELSDVQRERKRVFAERSSV
jgi:hypothetical protein